MMATPPSPPRPSRWPTCRAGRINHHWTKNIIASPDGTALYATVGSNSNAGGKRSGRRRGQGADHQGRPRHRRGIEVAGGLRNPNGMDWQPQSGALWTVVNERDELGDDLVPDYMTSVKPGAFYGWPFSYYGQHIDARVKPQNPGMVAKAIAPDYALGAHTASLGLAFYRGTALPGALPEWRLHRPAWLVEPLDALGLQGHLRALRQRPAIRHARGRPQRFPRQGRQGDGPPGRRDRGQERRPAGGRRRRQCHLARNGAIRFSHR
ncbi:MAG: PQQ-dependent sugar dehydrogenase [Asticcacaulis sp.]